MQVNKLDPGLGQVHLHKTFKLKLILNGKCGAINSGPILVLQRLFESDLNNGPSPKPFQSCVNIHLFRSPTYCFLCLPKGCRPDFNNGPVSDLNSGLVLGSRRLFESDSNNGPSPGHPSVASDEV